MKRIAAIRFVFSHGSRLAKKRINTAFKKSANCKSADFLRGEILRENYEWKGVISSKRISL